MSRTFWTAHTGFGPVGLRIEGNTLSGEEIDRLATLPPMDVLRGQLVGAVVAPLTQLLGLVSAPLRDLHGLIDARIEQLEEQGQVTEADAPKAQASAAEAEEPATDAEPVRSAEPADAVRIPEGAASAEPSDQDARPDSAVEDVGEKEEE